MATSQGTRAPRKRQSKKGRRPGDIRQAAGLQGQPPAPQLEPTPAPATTPQAPATPPAKAQHPLALHPQKAGHFKTWLMTVETGWLVSGIPTDLGRMPNAWKLQRYDGQATHHVHEFESAGGPVMICDCGEAVIKSDGFNCSPCDHVKMLHALRQLLGHQAEG